MSQAQPRLTGRTLLFARVGWLALVLPSLMLYVLGLPDFYVRLQRPCVDADTCAIAMSLSAQGIRSFAALGVSMSSYALFATVFWTTIVAIWTGLGLLVFWRRSDEWFALLASFALVMFNLSFPGLASDALALSHPALGAPLALMSAVGLFAFNSFFLLFPTGRLVPRWTGVAIPLMLAQTITNIVPPTSPINVANLGWISGPLALAMYGVIIYSQVYRYRRVSNATERQQTKWVAFAIVTVALCFIVLGGLFAMVFPEVNRQDSPASLFSLVYPLVLLLVPISVGFATLRYRLWDIELVIRRTLVYGLLSAFVIGCYVLIVGYLGALFRTNASLLISLIATGIVATLFQPLRAVLQTGVSRLVYGLRDEPYAVLAGLGQRLRATLDPDEMLPMIVATVREALKLSYVAIEAQRGADLVLVAASGTLPEKGVRRFPLKYQGEVVGALVIAPRRHDDQLTPADLRLLNDLTQQIGSAVHTVRLTSDLRRSREHLVMAREEERRRLRRDLHDGLGPTLSAIMLKVGLVRVVSQRDPAASDALLAQLEPEIGAVIDDIRRLVYDLRPPALDELGLVGAIREYIARLSLDGLSGIDAPVVTVETPGALPPLSAAVEVAAYRIVQEAVTNVLRHARARSCCVRMQAGDTLTIEVRDDGVGIAEDARGGIGLASMRERAEELGGSFTVRRGESSGTVVSARLPLTSIAAGDGGA